MGCFKALLVYALVHRQIHRVHTTFTACQHPSSNIDYSQQARLRPQKWNPQLRGTSRRLNEYFRQR